MEIPFDVADLPVALMRWDSNKLCENGKINMVAALLRLCSSVLFAQPPCTCPRIADLLRVPSLDDVCNWVPSKAIQFIDDLDEVRKLHCLPHITFP